MSYIGKEPQFAEYPSKFFNGDGTAMTVTLDYSPPNAAALLVFIDGVRQDTSAYTLSGTSLTFTGTVPSGTNNVQVVHLGIAQDTQVPVDDSVSTVKIQDDAVTSAKLDTNIAIDGDLTVDTDTLYIDSTNNAVGINTSSPSSWSTLAALDSNSTGFAGITAINSNANVGIGGIQFASDTTYTKAAIGLLRQYPNGGGALVFYNDSNADASNWTTSDEKMRIDSSGNLKFDSGYGSVATAYGCRAWVNFNGTGTVAIRDSGNVSSITDLGTGYYTVNFTTAMPDANYAVGGSAEGVQTYHMMTRSNGGTTTTSVRIRTGEPGGAYADVAICNVIIFR
jgi:hypothetical protein